MTVRHGRSLCWGLAASCLSLSASAQLAAKPADEAATQSLTVAAPLARTVYIRLWVSDAKEGRRQLQEIATQYGRLTRDSASWTDIDVPPAAEGSALRSIRVLGRVLGLRTATADLSKRLAQAESQLRVARGSQERLMSLSSGNVPDGLVLERARARAAERVEFAELELRELRQRSENVRIQIRLHAPTVESVRPAQLPVPWLSTLGPKGLHDPFSVEGKKWRELRHYLDGSLRLEGRHADQAGTLSENLNVLDAALSVRALGEATPIGIFGGADAALGGGSGFSYELQLMLGAGVAIGERLGVGVSSGPGVEGVTTTVPFGVTFPIELSVSWDTARWFATKYSVRNGWVLAADDRKKGSELAPFGDELAGSIHFVFADRDREGGFSEARDGFELGFEYRELMGARQYLLSVGYAGHISDFSGQL